MTIYAKALTVYLALQVGLGYAVWHYLTLPLLGALNAALRGH